MSMYNLLEWIKKVGRKIDGTLAGESVADEIKTELAKNSSLTVGFRLEPLIVRDALKAYNKLVAYGITDDELDRVIRHYVRYGIKEQP